MRVIGTAGHVDHGKSTLIAALTGTHPDRLKEEQEREMTIDLGFGWMTLPDGEEVGIVDVPGHRDFIENMLAGVGGLDAALLIVAADEGVMPQTREHLAILDLLEIPAGIVVITKVDLIQDADWLDLIEADIRTSLEGTHFGQAPTVRVSARTGEGLDKLLATLSRVLKDAKPRLDLGRPRLPVDRVFSMPGFGTVVTGTLSDGQLNLADEVMVLPSGSTGRVRGLQTHKKKEQQALPGSRTAINIAGLSIDEVRRGEVIVAPGHYRPTRRLDIRLRVLADASAVRHASQVKFFTGASETLGLLRLLESDHAQPGETTWAQLELRDPVVVARGDRFILRRPSPAETIGGGTVVDPHPRQRHRRMDAAVHSQLELLLKGSPADALLQAAASQMPLSIKDVVTASGLAEQAATDALRELIEAGALIILEDGSPNPASDLLAIPAAQWETLAERTIQIISTYHSQYPLRRGIPREELKSRLQLSPRAFNASLRRLIKSGQLVEAGAYLALPGHAIRFDRTQKGQVDALLAKFAAAPYAPPSIKECQAQVGEDVFAALIELGELATVSSEVVFRKMDYDSMVAKIESFIRERGQISVAETRDLFNTSRKYSLALLEHLDAIGITSRQGDFRTLRKP